jgi:prepilin signal peptidase PulO-like enzyme (type II secretory pathway)
LAGSVIAICGVSVLFGGQILLSRGRWLGTGDLWLGIGMAGLLGARDTAIAIYLAYMIGGLAAMVAMALRAIGPRGRIPFAPALVAGTMGAIWVGDAIAAWVSHAVS